MSPLAVAFLAFLCAALVGIVMWVLNHPHTSWTTVEARLCQKRLLGFTGDDAEKRVLITIERNDQTGEEYAWVVESAQHRDRLQLEKAKEIIALCKQGHSQCL